MARYDQFDPYVDNPRARVAVDYPDSDLGKVFGCGYNSVGNVVKGAGQTGIKGVMVVTQKPGRVGPLREVAVIDVLSHGTVLEFGPSDGTHVPGVDYGVAATNYYSDPNGFITSNQVSNTTQKVTISGGPTGGTFTITYSGQTTSAIPYNASAATVQAALQALSNIGSGNVTVTGNAGGPYTIVFGPSFNGVVAALTASGASLTGGSSPAATPSVVTDGTYVGYTIEPDRLMVHCG